MACRPIYIKFDNVQLGAQGLYDLVDSQNRKVFISVSSTDLAAGITFSVDSPETTFRLTNFRLSPGANPCETTTSTTTTTTTAPAWTPASITTSLWLDAADSGQVLLSGSNVTSWKDKSGNAYAATTTTEAERPTYNSTGLNGKGIVVFDGSQQLTSTLPHSQRGDMAIVFSRTSDSMPVLEKPNSGVLNYRGALGFAYPGFTWYTDYAYNGGSYVQAAPTQLSGIYVGSVKQSSGLDDATNLFVGGGSPGFQKLNGYIAEVVILPGSMSTDTKQKLEGYLAWKWGLVSSLPSGHPYKNSAP